jgi:hypothetical protein
MRSPPPTIGSFPPMSPPLPASYLDPPPTRTAAYAARLFLPFVFVVDGPPSSSTSPSAANGTSPRWDNAASTPATTQPVSLRRYSRCLSSNVDITARALFLRDCRDALSSLPIGADQQRGGRRRD